MKNKWKWPALTAGLAVIALVCIFGGQALADNVKAAQIAEAQANAAALSQEQPPSTPRVLPSLSPATPAAALPSEAVAPSAVPTAPGVTIVEDEQGNQVITPDWDAKADNAIKNGVVGGTEPDTNMGGGGGKLDLDKDGVYQGDHPGETPKPVPSAAPAPVPTPQQPTPVETPAPVPEVTPAPTQPSGGGATPPSYSGSYNGEISSDGGYMWGVGFGWVERGSGSQSIPENGPNSELSGIKVGEK